jgi:hypothetical protein
MAVRKKGPGVALNQPTLSLKPNTPLDNSSLSCDFIHQHIIFILNSNSSRKCGFLSTKAKSSLYFIPFYGALKKAMLQISIAHKVAAS